jgi:hypothetical protein
VVESKKWNKMWLFTSGVALKNIKYWFSLLKINILENSSVQLLI